MDRARRIDSSRAWTLVVPLIGAEKGVWGVERACHTGQQSVTPVRLCHPRKSGLTWGSRVLSRYAVTTA